LIRDVTVNFLGVAWQGGDLSGCGGYGCGTVFKLDSSRHETVLYTFTGGSDGANPNPALIRDASGNLYGVTEDGGDLRLFRLWNRIEVRHRTHTQIDKLPRTVSPSLGDGLVQGHR
jgi:hypothetical protein